MDDRQIVDLYWARDQRAIGETEARYGGYCYAIAYSALADAEDARECVNDTWLGAWNAMPDARPAVLSAFLGKITRRLAIGRWREKAAAKRGGGQVPLALEELAQCVPAGQSPEAAVELAELGRTVNGFVAALPETERKVFLCRYWYLDSVADIAGRFGFTQSKVKSMLARTRKRLAARLREEGYYADR